MQLQDLDAFSQWIESITFDTTDELWVAKLHPGKIIKAMSFSALANAINSHVLHEVVVLVAELLHENVTDVLKPGRRYPGSTHIRFVAALILKRRFNIPLSNISQSVGYTTHVGLYNALERAKTNPVVKQKIQKVYRAYPWLYRRERAIK